MAEGLYSRVDTQVLLNKDASRGGILRDLVKTLRTEERSRRQRPCGSVLLHYGAMVDGTLYLLPYDTDARDAVGNGEQLRFRSICSAFELTKLPTRPRARPRRLEVFGATMLDAGSPASWTAELRHELAAANTVKRHPQVGDILSGGRRGAARRFHPGAA